ncbi:MAG TPA: hypothetical protein VGM29_11705, partial [Polyangiaceae bacterium]
MTSSAERLLPNESEGPLASDPLAPILRLGGRAARRGAWIGLLGALITHGAVAAQAAHTLGAVLAFTVEIREQIRERLHQQFDIDLTPPPLPPPPPTQEPEPEQKAPPPPAANAAPPPPPAAAQAGKVLAQEADPNEPLDLTGNTFVTGSGDQYSGGVTASTGTSKTAVRDMRAEPAGVGKAPPGPVASTASAIDLSKPAMPVQGGSWNDCGFPPEADIEDINSAVVQLVVTVGSDGLPKAVTVTQD